MSSPQKTAAAIAASTKFNAERRKVILDGIRRGEFLTSAARRAGMGDSAVRKWVARGEAAMQAIEDGEKVDPIELEYAQFYTDMMLAEGTAEGDAVQELHDARTDGNWVATITYLERRFGARWRKHETREIVGADGGPIQHEVRRLDDSPDKLAEMVDVLLRAGIAIQIPGLPGLPAPATDEAEVQPG